jgi:hypothetical protein
MSMSTNASANGTVEQQAVVPEIVGGPRPRGRAIELDRVMVLPGRTATSALPPIGQSTTLHGIEVPAGIEVVHVLSGLVDLRRTPERTVQDMIGDGVDLPGDGFVTVVVKNLGDSPAEVRPAIYVSGGNPAARGAQGLGAPAAPSGPPRRKVIQARTTSSSAATRSSGANGGGAAAVGPSSVKRRIIADAGENVSRSRRSAAAGPERRARPPALPDDVLEVPLDAGQRGRLVALLESNVPVPAADMRRISYALIQAPVVGAEPRGTAVHLPRALALSLADHAQRRTPLAPDVKQVLVAALRPGARTSPRVVGARAARDVELARSTARVSIATPAAPDGDVVAVEIAQPAPPEEES